MTTAPAIDAPRFDPARRRRVTFALLLVTALTAFESTVVSTAMPTIIGELHGIGLYSWVFSAYLLFATVTMPIYGRLADLYGRRRILVFAGAVFLLGAVACASAQTMPQLIAARALQGLGAGGLQPVALTVTADLFSLAERARIQGVFSSVWGVASLVGPLLGAFLTVTFGWRSIFTINIPLGLVALVLVWTQMIESRAARPDPVDLVGAFTLGAGVVALLLSVLQRAGTQAMPPTARVALLVFAVAAIVVFARQQSRHAHPLIPPRLFKEAHTLAPYLGGAMLGTTIFGVDAFVPLFVQGARGGSAVAAGAVVTPTVLFWSMSAAVAAKAIVRFGFQRTARAGALLIFLGFVGLLAGAWWQAPVVWISVACAVIGCGLGPSSMAQVLAVQHVVPEGERAVATSLVPFFRAMGGAVGVGALGGILAAGLTARLGPAAATAGAALTTHADSPVSDAVRHALDQALFPVFLILLGLGAVNVVVTRFFPGEVETGAPRAPVTATAIE